MFDQPPDDSPWGNEPSWEDFFTIWIKFLRYYATYYGIKLKNNELMLPEGQNAVMLTVAKLRVEEVREKLHSAYPQHKKLIDLLSY